MRFASHFGSAEFATCIQGCQNHEIPLATGMDCRIAFAPGNALMLSLALGFPCLVDL